MILPNTIFKVADGLPEHMRWLQLRGVEIVSKEVGQDLFSIDPHGVDQAAKSGHRVNTEKHIMKENEQLEETRFGNPVRGPWESLWKRFSLRMSFAERSNLPVQNNLVEQMHRCEISEREDKWVPEFHCEWIELVD